MALSSIDLSLSLLKVLFLVKCQSNSYHLKRHVRGLREERVYKLPLASTLERCGTILAYGNKLPSRGLREVDSP